MTCNYAVSASLSLYKRKTGSSVVTRRTNNRKKEKITDTETALFLFVPSFVETFAGINRKPFRLTRVVLLVFILCIISSQCVIFLMQFP